MRLGDRRQYGSSSTEGSLHPWETTLTVPFHACHRVRTLHRLVDQCITMPAAFSDVLLIDPVHVFGWVFTNSTVGKGRSLKTVPTRLLLHFNLGASLHATVDLCTTGASDLSPRFVGCRLHYLGCAHQTYAERQHVETS